MTNGKGEKSRFVGREKELSDLEKILQEASEGKGRLALISGEAGIGKSRLVSELKKRAVSASFRCLEGDCVYHEVSDPYLPFIGALSDITTPSFVETPQKYVTIDEAFLIDNSGNVMSHAARIGANLLDSDIVGSMLSAVESFVKDAFGDGEDTEKGLETLEYGELKILIEHGKFVFLAVILSGGEPEGIREDLRRLVGKIEDTYFDIVKDWDGDFATVKEITQIIKNITTVKYRIKQAIRDIDIKKEKDRVFERVLQVLIDASKEDPLVLILEDIHWADVSSLQLLQYVARNTKEYRVMICCTYRPEEFDDVGDKKIHPLREAIQRMSRYKLFTTIELKSLYKEEASDMLKNLMASPDLPGVFVDRIYKETEGNPFFIEEMLYSLIDQEVIRLHEGIWQIGEVSEIQIPPTIKDIVMLRINRLDNDLMDLIKYASVIGQNFDFNILGKTEDVQEETLITALENLEEKKLIKADSVNDEIYRFNHAMIREVVYNSLSPQRRRMVHGKVALAMEDYYKDNLKDVVFQLAYHYSNTKDYDKALEYSIKAGDTASSQFALDEALRYCQLALGAISHMEETTDNKKR
ncbi:MAG: ATP-binding protein, partial [Candidatus Hermodarchaeia archaeon]